MTSSRQLGEVLRAFSSCDDSTGLSVLRSDAASRLDVDDGQSLNYIYARKQIKLAQTIESEIIPRLMMAHRIEAPLRPGRRVTSASPTREDVKEITRLFLEHEPGVARAYAEALLYRGATVESLYLDLLAPSARLMGELWEADIADFTQVTEGLFRLQHLFHELSPVFENEELKRANINGKILLVPVPGEQHIFGLMIVEEFLRRMGLECRSNSPETQKELVRLVRDDHFDVVGLSASCDVHVSGVESAIKAIRKSSKNKSVSILVGGALFTNNPERVAAVGADGCAHDGRDAALKLRDLLDKRLSHAR